MTIDHPIFIQSILTIQSKLKTTRADPYEQDVLERLIHTTGDFGIEPLLSFTPLACKSGIQALKAGATILTDTFMAKVAIESMASRTLGSDVRCILEWAPKNAEKNLTRSAIGIKKAWPELSNKLSSSQAPLAVIGSAPTALEALIDLIDAGACQPSLIIGMPVGFVGVVKSKERLASFDCEQIRINGNRGGAAMAASVVNSLLRSSIQGS